MKLMLTLIMLGLILAACVPGLSSEEIAQTMVAETAAAATATPAATETPEPTATPTLTDTPLPTATPTLTPTETPEPTETPTTTPTPGPLVFLDDFSTNSGAWIGCDYCDWRRGELVMGPWPAANSFAAYFTVCEACGTPVYYRMAVDVTYVEGPTDRGYGLLIKLGDDSLVDLEISTFQTAILWKYDRKTGAWSILDGRFTGLLDAAYGTNRLEVEVRPSSNGKADMFINLNGRNWTVLFGQPADEVEVGLLVGLHSISVAFDNFEFEEIEP